MNSTQLAILESPFQTIKGEKYKRNAILYLFDQPLYVFSGVWPSSFEQLDGTGEKFKFTLTYDN